LPVHINADPDDRDQASLAIVACLNQNAADFALVDQDIVWPFNRRFNLACLCDCPHHRQRCNHHQQMRRKEGSQDKRGEDITSRRINPATALSAFTGSLAIG